MRPSPLDARRGLHEDQGMNTRPLPTLLTAFLLSVSCTPASASVIVTIVGDEVDAQISVSAPGGPTYNADFKLNFQDPVNLSEACLGLSATYLDAVARAAIEARMPQSGLQIDPDFPVLISVSPPAACGLVFRNEVRVELRTENLVYAANTPYRLYKAPTLANFRNITNSVVSGSVRARGSSGGFSDFVMVRDTTPDLPADANQAYDALTTRLSDPDIDPVARRVLEDSLALSRAAFAAGNYAAALDHVDDMRGNCGLFAGDELDNEWHATGDVENDEGEIVSLIAPLEFALDRLANP
jgi:hypothetical protein